MSRRGQAGLFAEDGPMTFPVLVEPHEGWFAASLAGVPEVRGIASTREEAIAALENQLADRIAQGELLSVEIADAGVVGLAGKFADDPCLREISYGGISRTRCRGARMTVFDTDVFGEILLGNAQFRRPRNVDPGQSTASHCRYHTHDLRIAAISVDHSATLVSRNRRDFDQHSWVVGRVLGLKCKLTKA